jgi:hypothetical protein
MFKERPRQVGILQSLSPTYLERKQLLINNSINNSEPVPPPRKPLFINSISNANKQPVLQPKLHVFANNRRPVLQLEKTLFINIKSNRRPLVQTFQVKSQSQLNLRRPHTLLKTQGLLNTRSNVVTGRGSDSATDYSSQT